MKSNLISGIASWKSAALLALVAIVAAVAFSGVLTNTQTADAQSVPLSAPPGATVVVTFAGATGGTAETPTRFRISTDSEGSATFSNGAQNISCYPNSPTGCDANTDATTGAGVSLRVTIDDDSPIGQIFVQQVARENNEFTVTQEYPINVIPANPPAAIRAHGTPPAAALTANPQNNENVAIGAQLVNARGAGIAGTNLLVTTTRGVLNSADATVQDACTNVSACTLATRAAEADDNDPATTEDPAGIVSVTLSGNGATGPAEVTFRELVSGLTHTATVILHGPAASISAEVDQGTIGGGGSTFVVVTVLDADGNPAVNATDVDFRSNKPLTPAITGPEVPAGSSAVLLAYSLVVDRLAPGHPAYLPSCGERAAVEAQPTATPPVVGVPASTGTSTAGKCVIQVTAQGGDTPSPADDSTRGTHTLTVGTSDARIPTVNVEVQVGGAPASIETDAPARVDSLSSTGITVTVLDDEGVRVGAVPISVVSVEGSGNVDDVPRGMTSDGRGTFTFLAPLSSGEAVFLVRAGDAAKGQQIQTSITLAIGPEPEEVPDAPPATWSAELASGTWNLVWNGEDGADPADGAAEGVTAIWQWNGSSWDGYFPAAADVPGGNTLDSLSNGAAYWVIVE